MSNPLDVETSTLDRDVITKLALDDLIVHYGYCEYERGDITYEQMLIGMVAILVNQKQNLIKRLEDIVNKRGNL